MAKDLFPDEALVVFTIRFLPFHKRQFILSAGLPKIHGIDGRPPKVWHFQEW